MTEIQAPIEQKTGRIKLYMQVFSSDVENSPESYVRVLKTQLGHLSKLLKTITEFYQKTPITEQKLHLGKLSSLSGIGSHQVSIILKQFAGKSQLIMRDENQEYKLLLTFPRYKLQQAFKHRDKRYWGKLTPIYILPLEKKVMEK